MGKRSDFEREKLDFYPTPMEAVTPLLPHLRANTRFCEPCAGAGDLVRHLEAHGHVCTSAFDVEPQNDTIWRNDASFIQRNDLRGADVIITNPPWDRKPLHQIIERCSTLTPTWLLFDADWMFTKQAKPYLRLCDMIVSIGRVKWIADSPSAGMDNACWYRFTPHFSMFTQFYNK